MTESIVVTTSDGEKYVIYKPRLTNHCLESPKFLPATGYTDGKYYQVNTLQIVAWRKNR